MTFLFVVLKTCLVTTSIKCLSTQWLTFPLDPCSVKPRRTRYSHLQCQCQAFRAQTIENRARDYPTAQLPQHHTPICLDPFNAKYNLACYQFGPTTDPCALRDAPLGPVFGANIPQHRTTWWPIRSILGYDEASCTARIAPLRFAYFEVVRSACTAERTCPGSRRSDAGP